jgi:hypothetical protein
MKPYLLIAVLAGWLALPAQSTEKIKVYLKNNGSVPREFKFVTFQPGDKYRDVFTTYLLPGATHKIEYKVGTSIAQVNQAEIYQIMKGLDVHGKPLIVLKTENKGQTIKLLN